MNLTAETLQTNCLAWLDKHAQFVQAGDTHGQELALCQLAVNHNHLQKYDDAIDYFAQALTLNLLSRNSIRRFWALMGIGVAYISKLRASLGIQYFQQALDLAIEMDDPHLIHVSRANLSQARCDVGVEEWHGSRLASRSTNSAMALAI